MPEETKQLTDLIRDNLIPNQIKMNEQLTNLAKTVDALDHMIRGNGEGKGIAYKIKESNDCIERVERDMEKIVDASEKMEDVVFGTEKDKGILGRLDSIENWIDTRKWLERVIIVAIVGEVLLELFSLIKNGYIR